jgi:hypothetical protein
VLEGEACKPTVNVLDAEESPIVAMDPRVKELEVENDGFGGVERRI